MEKELVGYYQLKNRMKQFLPEESNLSGEAVKVMSKTLNEIFNSIMTEIGKQPYKDFTGYIVSKECSKYVVQGNSLTTVIRVMKNLRGQIDEWFEQLNEGIQ